MAAGQGSGHAHRLCGEGPAESVRGVRRAVCGKAGRREDLFARVPHRAISKASLPNKLGFLSDGIAADCQQRGDLAPHVPEGRARHGVPKAVGRRAARRQRYVRNRGIS